MYGNADFGYMRDWQFYEAQTDAKRKNVYHAEVHACCGRARLSVMAFLWR